MIALGAKKDQWDRRDYRAAGITAPAELPESFRLTDPFPVKSQNGFGSCTGQAAAGHKQLQEGVELSARFAYAMTKKLEGNTSWGAYTRDQFKVLCDVGAVPEEAWPERHDIPELEYLDWKNIPPFVADNAKLYRSKKYFRVEPDFESIKQALFNAKQAIVISIPWYGSYNAPKNGYLYLDNNSGFLGHAVLVVGWKKDALVIKNSFGESWGLSGMCYLPKEAQIWDAWYSVDMPEKLPVESRYGLPRNFAMEKVTAFNPWLYKKIKRLPNNLEINALWYGKWDFASVFKGRVGDTWLYEIKK